MTHDAQLDTVLGEASLDDHRYASLTQLADSILTNHWHVTDLPWRELPLFPFPPDLDGRRRQSFVRFGKRAVRVQLAAEHVAARASRHLLEVAETEGLDLSVRRALAALHNDEASHVVVMTEMDARAELEYPDVPLAPAPSPLLGTFAGSLTSLHPALVALFMGCYEALVAIRDYAEQAGYDRPSILGEMARRASQDDGRHAKVMRLVAHEWLDRLRAVTPPAERDVVFRERILGPCRTYWRLLLEHEYYLLENDPRRIGEWDLAARSDSVLGQRFMKLVDLTEADVAFIGFEEVRGECRHWIEEAEQNKQTA